MHPQRFKPSEKLLAKLNMDAGMKGKGRVEYLNENLPAEYRASRSFVSGMLSGKRPTPLRTMAAIIRFVERNPNLSNEQIWERKDKWFEVIKEEAK